MTVDTYTSK